MISEVYNMDCMEYMKTIPDTELTPDNLIKHGDREAEKNGSGIHYGQLPNESEWRHVFGTKDREKFNQMLKDSKEPNYALNDSPNEKEWERTLIRKYQDGYRGGDDEDNYDEEPREWVSVKGKRKTYGGNGNNNYVNSLNNDPKIVNCGNLCGGAFDTRINV
jgi:hypothetical protein